MQRQVSLGKLRGLDPVTLEVTITEALRRPMGQLDAASLVDLLALAEHEEPPARLRPDLALFKERIEREISDLPDGHVWQEFLDELARLDAERIAEGTRELLSTVARAEGRAAATAEALAPLEEVWEEIPAEPFEMSGQKRRVEKHEVMNTSESITNRKGIGIAREKPKKARRSGGAVRSGSGGAPNRRAAPRANPVDKEKLDFLVQTCLERLNRYKEAGLAENILIVGVRKKAEEQFPGTSGQDVQAALKHLEDIGRAKRSAGRWLIKGRWG